jgi:hypothetical protein
MPLTPNPLPASGYGIHTSPLASQPSRNFALSARLGGEGEFNKLFYIGSKMCESCSRERGEGATRGAGG